MKKLCDYTDDEIEAVLDGYNARSIETERGEPLTDEEKLMFIDTLYGQTVILKHRKQHLLNEYAAKIHKLPMPALIVWFAGAILTVSLVAIALEVVL